MPTGRRPKATADKLLRGNPGQRPINLREPQPAIIDQDIPAGLDAYGRACWKRNAPILTRMGVLTEADTDLLAVYCDVYSQWRKASAAFRKLNPLDEDYRKAAVSVEKARDQMRLLAVEFGMTPSSRSRLSVGKPKDDTVDPMESLLSGRRSA